MKISMALCSVGDIKYVTLRCGQQAYAEQLVDRYAKLLNSGKNGN